MKYVFCSLLFLIFIQFNVLSSSTIWTKTYGGAGNDVAFDIQNTSDGCYIVTGYTNSFGTGDYDVYLLKIDSFGDTVWTKTYGGQLNEYANSVRQTSDGGFIITGYIMGSNYTTDVLLIKTDSNGNTEWTKYYSHVQTINKGHSVLQTSDDGYVICSEILIGNMNIWVIRTNSLGDTLWTRHWDFNDCMFYSMDFTDDNGFIFAGVSGWENGNLHLLRIDSYGNHIWNRHYGGDSLDWGHSICQIPEDKYLVAAHTKSFGAGKCDLWILKIDSIGDTIWTKTFGGNKDDVPFSIQYTTEKNIIITGYTKSFGVGNSDVWLLCLDTNGDTLWTRTFGGDSGDVGQSVIQTPDGGYVIAANTSSYGNGNSDIYLIKTDTLGYTVSVEEEHNIIISSNFITFEYLSGKQISLKYFLEESSYVKIEIYDLSGRLISSTGNRYVNQGINDVNLKFLYRGIYFVKIITKNQTIIKKISIIQ